MKSRAPKNMSLLMFNTFHSLAATRLRLCGGGVPAAAGCAYTDKCYAL